MMRPTSSVADAKRNLREVLTIAQKEVQVIRRGVREYVVMAAREYRKVRGLTPSFLDHLINGGPRGVSLEPMPRCQTMLRESPPPRSNTAYT